MNSSAKNLIGSEGVKKGRARAAILAVSLLLMGTTAVSPAMAKLADSFPDAAYSTVSLVVGLPSVLFIPFSILAGIVAERWNNKLVLTIGLAIYAVSGISGVFAESLTALLIGRCFFGAGIGIISPFSTGLIADFFEGAERVRLMGFQSAAVSVGSIMSSFAVGFLAARDWHNAFWVYALAIAILVLVIVCLPNTSARKPDGGKRERPNKQVYMVSLKIFLFSAVYLVYFTYLALLIVEKNIGDTVSGGLTLTVGTLGGMAAGIFFSGLCKYLGKYVSAAAFASVGIGFILFGFAQNFGMLIIGAVFAGIGFSVTSCNASFQISLVSPKTAMMTSMGILVAAVNVGQFVSPYFSAGISRILGDDSAGLIFICAGALMLAAFAVSGIMSRRKKSV